MNKGLLFLLFQLTGPSNLMKEKIFKHVYERENKLYDGMCTNKKIKGTLTHISQI